MSLSKVIDSLAGVNTPVKRAGLADLKRTHTLVAEHAVTWVIYDGNLVFHPEYLRL